MARRGGSSSAASVRLVGKAAPPRGLRHALDVKRTDEIYSKFRLYSSYNTVFRKFYSIFHIDYGPTASKRPNMYEISYIFRQSYRNPQILFDFSHIISNDAPSVHSPATRYSYRLFTLVKYISQLPAAIHHCPGIISEEAQPTAGSTYAARPPLCRQLDGYTHTPSLGSASQGIRARTHDLDRPVRDIS